MLCIECYDLNELLQKSLGGRNYSYHFIEEEIELRKLADLAWWYML
jgi:hypothetical protein